VLYRKTGTSGWVVGAISSVGGGTQTIPDLTPGTSYDFETQGKSFNNVIGTPVAATGSPFAAPNKTSQPTAPTTVNTTAPTASSGVPPSYDNISEVNEATIATWNGVADTDVVSYEAYSGYAGSPPSNTAAIGSLTGSQIIKSTVGFTGQYSCFFYTSPLLTSNYVWVRSIDSSGNFSNWVTNAATCNYSNNYCGDLGQQNENSTQLSGLTTAPQSASSTIKTLVVMPLDGSTVGTVMTLTGGSPTETHYLNISGWGFTAKPSVGYITLLSSNAGSKIQVEYNYDDASNSSTQAACKFYTSDNSNLPNLAVRISGVLMQNT
jgi:hypothetical protein